MIRLEKISKQIIPIVAFILVALTGYTQCDLNCYGSIDQTIAPLDQVSISYNMLLDGDYSNCPQNYELSLKDESGAFIQPAIINGSHIGQTLTATIIDQDNVTTCDTEINVITASFNCIDTLYIDIETVLTASGNELEVSFKVENFTGLSSMQMSIEYDSELLNYLGFLDSDLTDIYESNFAEQNEGAIRMLWFNSFGGETTLDDGSTIFKLKFFVLDSGTAEFKITNTPLPIEIATGEGELFCLNVDGTPLDLDNNNGNTNCTLDCLGEVVASYNGNPVLVNANDFFVGDINECTNLDLVLSLFSPTGTIYNDKKSHELNEIGNYTYILKDLNTNETCTGVFRLIGTINSACIDTIYMDIEEYADGDIVFVEFNVEEFDEVASLQFTINYDVSYLVFNELHSSNLPGMLSSSINESAPGEIRVVWYHPAGEEFSLNDGNDIFTLSFMAIDKGTTNIDVNGSAIPVELANGLGQTYCLNLGNTSIEVDGSATPCDINCISELRYNFNTTPIVFVSSDKVLQGNYAGCGQFEVEVFDDNGNLLPTSPSINFNGPDETYDYTVTQLNTGNACSGTIKSYAQASNECPDTLYVDLQSKFDGEKVTLDVIVYNFNDIASLQLPIKFDNEVLEYEGFLSSDIPSFIETNTNVNENYIYNTWSDPSTFGMDLEDGSTIMSFSFKALKNSLTRFEILGTTFIAVEVVNGNLEELCVNANPEEINVDGAHYYGYIINDANLDCIEDADEKGLDDWFITLTNGVEVYNFDTDENGYYSMVVPPGTYTISAHAPNDLWTFCDNDIVGITMNDDEFFNYNFLAYPEKKCSYMTADLSAPFLRRCFESEYFIKFCNQGTIDESDAYIEVELDEDLSFVSTNFSDYDLDGQLLSFNIGNVAVGACDVIKFKVDVSCDAELGQTHCSKATIFPIPDCMNLNSNWSGASLRVDATCDSDSIRFAITNDGLDMVAHTSFIVIEEDVMKIEDSIQLDANQLHALSFPKDGKTYRVTAYQVDDHPMKAIPTAVVEACGTDDDGMVSTGFVNMFENGDGDPWVDIDCQENIGSFDPNDKVAFPKGYRDEHYIMHDTKLEYKLRFQNTGTDTAFKVVIRDTLSDHLDLLSIELGASSHPYVFSLEDSKVLVFTFDKINLVSQEEDDFASNGFVKFKISQKQINPDGTKILNHSDIYFDFNEPIKTNTVDHLIGSDYVSTIVSTIDINVPDVAVSIYPNPFRGQTTIDIGNLEINNAELDIYSLLGVKIGTHKLDSNLSTIDVGQLPIGTYLFRISNNGKPVATGKLIAQ